LLSYPGGAFRKAKNEIRRRRKNRNRKARAGKNSFSQTLSLFARPSGKSKILFKKSSSFCIKTAQKTKNPLYEDFLFLWQRESNGQQRDKPSRRRRAPMNADEHSALPRARNEVTRNSRYPLKFERVFPWKDFF